MGYPVLPNSIFQITFEGSLYGQQVMTVMTYRFAAPADGDGPTITTYMKDYVNTALTGLYATYRACLSVDVVDLVQYYQWITPTRYAYDFLVPTARTGAIAQPAGAANLAQVVTRRGELAQRDNISNLHLPGIPQSVYEAGIITDGGHLDLLSTFVNTSTAQPSPAAGQTLYPSAFKRSSPADSAVLVTGIVGLTVRDMRRRTVGVGT